jgi:uncharacterized membrane protein
MVSMLETQPQQGFQGSSSSQPSHQATPSRAPNVGQNERSVSVAAGAILALLGLRRMSLPGCIVAGVGGAMIYRGVTGYCNLYGALGIDTHGSVEEDVAKHGIHIEQAFLINRSAEDLYNDWRNFENLPNTMSHLESVQVLDNRRSRWVAKAPRIVGGQVEWEAEITADEPNSRIAWRSVPGATIENFGEVRFSPALGDRGTEVHVTMKYLPPAGRLGHWAATMFGASPSHQIREDLRNFKRRMETGEVPTVEGQSRGTCMGLGKREGE